MSYVREDDKYGRLSEFRERLEDEVRTQLGEPFPIFQDRNHILWGQNWKTRIESALDAVTFLIPIITPSFFRSAACRGELQRFVDRESALGRSDLILPVYYVDTPVINDGNRRVNDPLAMIIATRQYVDWRSWRFEPFSSPEAGKLLSGLGVQIREALDRLDGSQASEISSGRSVNPSPRASGGSGTANDVDLDVQVAIGPARHNEPPTWIVDPLHRGDYATIGDAIQVANPGDRILVRPGYYEESLLLNKPLEIVGEGELSEIEVRAVDEPALRFHTTMGRVTNLTFRQGGNHFGVEIAQGRLELEGCDISSEGLACVAILNSADPRLRRNRIHSGSKGGVFIYANGRGTLEENEIYGNALSGVEISEQSNPTLRRNRIFDGKLGGIFVQKNGRGTLEENEISGNAAAGVEITSGGDPILRRNRIHSGKSNGLYVHENGRGNVEDNEIFANSYNGVMIDAGGHPVLTRNRIRDNESDGVYIGENGHGTLEGNEISNNGEAGVHIAEGGSAEVRRNGITKNGFEAVWVDTGGSGTFYGNDLRDNRRGPWDIDEDSPEIHRSDNQE